MTSSTQLEHFFRNEKRFGGVLSKDEVRKYPRGPGGKFWILNLEDSDKGDGTHWILSYDCDPDVSYFFDSYGIGPPDVVKRWMAKSGKDLVWNQEEVQKYTTATCGEFCVFVACNLLRGYSMLENLKRDPSDVNEREVAVGFKQRNGYGG
jgi:hypothetical protein